MNRLVPGLSNALTMATSPPAKSDRPTVICIVGTPRSGTSLTARILNLAGVYLGPESEMVPAGPWNPKGFWENRHIAALNRRLLKTLNREGLAPPRLPPGWATSEALDGERKEARALLSKTFDGHQLWGWKEAGTTLVLPFWQQLLPQMHYVICLRNPIDVASSAHRIEGAGPQITAAWPKHVAAALAYTTGSPRILVSYDDYLHTRRTTIERLWRFVGNETGASASEAARLEESIDESLLHNHTPLAETLRDADLPLETSSMYLITELLRRAMPDPWEGQGEATKLQESVDAHARRLIGL